MTQFVSATPIEPGDSPSEVISNDRDMACRYNDCYYRVPTSSFLSTIDLNVFSFIRTGRTPRPPSLPQAQRSHLHSRRPLPALWQQQVERLAINPSSCSPQSLLGRHCFCCFEFFKYTLRSLSLAFEYAFLPSPYTPSKLTCFHLSVYLGRSLVHQFLRFSRKPVWLATYSLSYPRLPQDTIHYFTDFFVCYISSIEGNLGSP